MTKARSAFAAALLVAALVAVPVSAAHSATLGGYKNCTSTAQQGQVAQFSTFSHSNQWKNSANGSPYSTSSAAAGVWLYHASGQNAAYYKSQTSATVFARHAVSCVAF